MSKVRQLIFTSTPIGLEPGRSGYCTVARSQNLSKKEIREIEKLSVLDYSISKSSPPKVHSFRTVQTINSFFYLLSRIKSCGIDYSNRTNYIAHHLIVEPESIKLLPSPSEIFQFWEIISSLKNIKIVYLFASVSPSRCAICVRRYSQSQRTSRKTYTTKIIILKIIN